MIKIWRSETSGWRSSEPLPEPFLVIKKPVPVKAHVMSVPFVTDSLEGNELRGNAGDVLIQGVVGEFYPCNVDVFYETYDRLTFWTRLRFAVRVLFAR